MGQVAICGTRLGIYACMYTDLFSVAAAAALAEAPMETVCLSFVAFYDACLAYLPQLAMLFGECVAGVGLGIGNRAWRRRQRQRGQQRRLCWASELLMFVGYMYQVVSHAAVY